jgi:hypothetical protein
MNEIDVIASKYAKKNAKVEKIEERIMKLEAKRDKYNTPYWYWTNRLIRPILNLVKAKFPQVEWDKDKRLVPLGLTNRVSVFGMYKNKHVMISFIPTDTRNGRISFETDKREQEYPENSIGAWNNMGLERIELTDVQQLYDYVQKQLNEIDIKVKL